MLEYSVKRSFSRRSELATDPEEKKITPSLSGPKPARSDPSRTPCTDVLDGWTESLRDCSRKY